MNDLIFLADLNWGTNIKTWIINQAGGLAIAAIVIILIPLILKKQWSNLIGTLIVGAIAIYFVNNPDTLKDIGEGLYGIINGVKK